MRDGWVMIKPPRGRIRVEWCERNIVDSNTVATLIRQGCIIEEVDVVPAKIKEVVHGPAQGK